MAELMPCYFSRTKNANDIIGKRNKNCLIETNKSGTMLFVVVPGMIFRSCFRIANLHLPR